MFVVLYSYIVACYDSIKKFQPINRRINNRQSCKMGFENVRWTDTPEERVYVVENSAYKIQALGIRKAVDIIQSMGLPKDNLVS